VVPADTRPPAGTAQIAEQIREAIGELVLAAD
jgi:hypothetical protein